MKLRLPCLDVLNWNSIRIIIQWNWKDHNSIIWFHYEIKVTIFFSSPISLFALRLVSGLEVVGRWQLMWGPVPLTYRSKTLDLTAKEQDTPNLADACAEWVEKRPSQNFRVQRGDVFVQVWEILINGPRNFDRSSVLMEQ